MEKKFTLYWLDGKKNTVTGFSIADAMNKAGYGAGAVRALDFYDEGNSLGSYGWNPNTRSWVRADQAS